MVVEVLLARDQLLAVCGREEEAAALVVAEQLDREERESARLLEPARLAGRDVKLVEPVRDVGVVLEEARVLGDAVPVGAVQASVGRRQRTEQELAESPRCGEPLVVSEARTGFGQRRQREAVPRRDRLVVAKRLRPLLPPLEQLRLQLGRQLAAQDEAAVLERLEELLRDAVVSVHVKVSPSTPSVSASCAEAKPPSGSASSRSRYVDRLVDDLAIALGARHEPAVEVGGDEQRVVVEHLLEVRHQPALVDGVPVEAAAQQVVHAAERHAVERLDRRLELAAAQEELDRRRLRELRRPAPAAPAFVEARAKAAHGLAQEPVRERLARGLDARRRTHGIGQRLRLPHDVARVARDTRRTPSRAPGESSAGRDAAPAESRCRRERARRPA